MIIDILKGCFIVEPQNRLSISQIMKKMEKPSLDISKISHNANEKSELLFKPRRFNNKKKKTFQEIFLDLETFSNENFDICELLGIGNFSKAYKVYDKTLKNYYCMTINNDNDDQKKRDNYLNKVAASTEIKKLNHPAFLIHKPYKDSQKKDNIILISDLGLADMKKVLTYRKNAYSESETLFIILKLMKGLAVAQQRNISIQDIKPENILLIQHESGKFLYKFFDYGKSIVLENGANLCNPKDLQGYTYFYAAPEIIAIGKHLDADLESNNIEKFTFDPFKADIFSLGIVILLLIGNTRNAIRRMRKKNFEDFSPYMQLDYPNLTPVIKLMLQTDPSKRSGFSEILEKIAKMKRSPPNENEFIKLLEDEKKKGKEKLILEKIQK